MKLKRRRKLMAGVYTAQVAVAEAGKCGLRLLVHPLYIPDIALSKFFIFSILKKKITVLIFFFLVLYI